MAQLQREVEVLAAERLKQQAVIHDLQRNLVLDWGGGGDRQKTGTDGVKTDVWDGLEKGLAGPGAAGGGGWEEG
jgi:hypothetical protein